MQISLKGDQLLTDEMRPCMNMYLCFDVFLSIWLAEDALVSTYTEQMEQYVPIWLNYLPFCVLNPIQFYIIREKNDRF
jgi:hypothetical protein